MSCAIGDRARGSVSDRSRRDTRGARRRQAARERSRARARRRRARSNASMPDRPVAFLGGELEVLRAEHRHLTVAGRLQIVGAHVSERSTIVRPLACASATQMAPLTSPFSISSALTHSPSVVNCGRTCCELDCVFCLIVVTPVVRRPDDLAPMIPQPSAKQLANANSFCTSLKFASLRRERHVILFAARLCEAAAHLHCGVLPGTLPHVRCVALVFATVASRQWR